MKKDKFQEFLENDWNHLTKKVARMEGTQIFHVMLTLAMLGIIFSAVR